MWALGAGPFVLDLLGFAQGIQPKLVAKVVVYYQPTRIIAFANGPGGGDQRFCRPE